MNIKKYLKKKAQEDLESLRTDRDQEILQRLKNSVAEEPPKARRNLKWLWAIPSVVTCVVAAVLIVELVPFSDRDSGGVRYDEINFERKDSDFSELTNALTNLSLHFTNAQEFSVIRTYDSLSGDNIYFTVNIAENSMEATYNMELRIVVNENYDYEDFVITDEFKTETYSEYSIIYKQLIKTDSSIGLNTISCSAKIVNAKYEMYVVSYEEYSFTNGTFLTVINNLLEFHG